MSEAARTAVFVHGAGGGGWEWGVWARVFAANGWTVLAPDLQPSPRGLAATALADYADQVGAWVDGARSPRRLPSGVVLVPPFDRPADPAAGAGEGGAAGGPRVVLIGASLGGLLALMNADRADALVLVNPLPPSGLPAPEPVPAIVPWGLTASLAGTRRALPDADELTCLSAFRRWRDESGRVLAQARAGVAVGTPACPVQVLVSGDDREVPPDVSARLAVALGADRVQVPGSHVGPLLGRQAAGWAVACLAWLDAVENRPRIQSEFGPAG